MADTDDDALKVEIDEIMSNVDAIMEKVARVIPDDQPDSDSRD
jgi:hypothetical protein